MVRARWALHPLTAALALLLTGAAGAAWATDRAPAPTGALLLLVAVAGAAAGFANSGST